MIDVHAHLVDKKFRDDVDVVIQRAKDGGLRGVVVVPEFASEWEKVLALRDAHPQFIGAALGAHPIQKSNKSAKSKHIEGLEELVRRRRESICCIGEVGLDFSERFKLKDEDKKEQMEVFRRQIQLAKAFDLPLNIHSRGAPEETLSLLKELVPLPPVVIHAFGGTPQLALEAVSVGFYISIPPAFSIGDEVRSSFSS